MKLSHILEIIFFYLICYCSVVSKILEGILSSKFETNYQPIHLINLIEGGQDPLIVIVFW